MTILTRSALDYNEDNRVDLAGILRAAYDHKLMITLITGCFAVLGVLYALMATPVYRTYSMIQLEPKKAAIDGAPEVIPRPDTVSPAMTELELIRSRAVLGQAVESLKLHIKAEPAHFPLIGGFMARQHDPLVDGPLASPPTTWLSGFAWGGEKLDIYRLDVPDQYLGMPLTLVTEEAGHFSLYDEDDQLLLQGTVGEQIRTGGFDMQVAELQARPGTRFDVERDHPQTTALEYRKILHVQESGKGSGIINLSIEDPDLDKANRFLDEIGRLYVRQNIDRTSAEASQRLDFLHEQIPLVRKELEKAENALNKYQTTARSIDVDMETKTVLDQIVAIDTSLSELNLKRVEFNRLYTREHPSFQTLLRQIGQLEAEKAKLMRKVDQLPKTQQELLRLRRDMEVTTQTYTLLMNKAQEQDIIRAGAIGNVRIVDRAYSAIEGPAKPNRIQVVAIAILAGLLVSVLAILVRKAFYRGIEAPAAIERLGLPVFAALPHTGRQERLERNRLRGRKDRLLGLANPDDLAVESLRSLRTSIKFAMLESRNNIIAITSPTPGMGKSFISSNLAVVIAKTDQKVLLIDADMRRGYLDSVFGIDMQEGLADALAERLRLARVVYNTPVPNLHFIPAGTSPANPSELLMHASFQALLREASQRYDLIIIDTPPVLAVTDGVVIAQEAGCTLLVTRYGRSTPAQVEAAKTRLAQNGVMPKGAILNDVRRKASNSAYDSGAYGYYRYPTRT